MPQKGNLTCPEDANKLTKYVIQGHQVDACKKCGGIFFDDQTFSNVLSEHDLSSHDDEILLDMPLSEKQLRKTNNAHFTRYCPKDNDTYTTKRYAKDSDVWIDECPTCRSIWLDRKELSKIRQYLISSGQNVYEDDDPDEYSKVVGKFILQSQKDTKRMRNELSVLPYAILAPFVLIPYGDTGMREKLPIGTITLIVLNVLVYIFFNLGASFDELIAFFNNHGLVPELARDPTEALRYISSMFIHAGIVHLIGNMLFLWIFGDNVEEKLGLGYFFFMYVIMGLAASIVFISIDLSSSIPLIGASGAISGLMGIYIILFPHKRIKMALNPLGLLLARLRGMSIKVPPIPAWMFLGMWFFYQALYASTQSSEEGGVAFLAHVAGFVVGVIIALLYKQEVEHNAAINVNKISV